MAVYALLLLAFVLIVGLSVALSGVLRRLERLERLEARTDPYVPVDVRLDPRAIAAAGRRSMRSWPMR